MGENIIKKEYRAVLTNTHTHTCTYTLSLKEEILLKYNPYHQVNLRTSDFMKIQKRIFNNVNFLLIVIFSISARLDQGVLSIFKDDQDQ